MRCGECQVNFSCQLNYCRYCGRRLRRDEVATSYQTSPLDCSVTSSESAMLQGCPDIVYLESKTTGLEGYLPRPVKMHVRTATGFTGRMKMLWGTGCRWLGRAIFHGLNLII